MCWSNRDEFYVQYKGLAVSIACNLWKQWKDNNTSAFEMQDFIQTAKTALLEVFDMVDESYSKEQQVEYVRRAITMGIQVATKRHIEKANRIQRFSSSSPPQSLAEEPDLDLELDVSDKLDKMQQDKKEFCKLIMSGYKKSEAANLVGWSVRELAKNLSSLKYEFGGLLPNG